MSSFSNSWGRMRPNAKTPLALLDQCGLAGASDLTRGMVVLTLQTAHPHNNMPADQPTENRVMNAAILVVGMVDQQELEAFLQECGRVEMMGETILAVATRIVGEAANAAGASTPGNVRIATAALFILASETNNQMHVQQPQADSPPVA